MKCGLLVNAIGCIDGAFIDEAESYKPKRKMPVWIWTAASAACLCVVVLFAALFDRNINCEAELLICFGGEAEHGYVNYRERAENGKVLITDELISLMDENKDTRCRNCQYAVRITDANGAGSDVTLACLAPLNLSSEKRVEFVRDGVVTLSRKEIYAVKGLPELALIISPVFIGIDEEYLNTVGRDTLDVWVALEFNEEFNNEYEYMEEYDRLDSVTRYELIEGQISRFFEKEFGDHVELDDEFKKFLEDYDSLDLETRHRGFVKNFSRLMYQKCTEYGINGDPIMGYRETGGHVDLDMQFKSFIHEEHVYRYFEKYAEEYGIDIESIKEYREVSAVFNAELDTELIGRLLQDERTRLVVVTDI